MGVDVQHLSITGSRRHDLIGALRTDVDPLAERVLSRLAGLPSCRGVSAPELRADVRQALTHLVGTLATPIGRDRDHPSAGLPVPGHRASADFSRTGERLAAQGLSAADLQRLVRLVLDEVIEHSRRVLPLDAVTDRLLVDLLGELLNWHDTVLLAVGQGHRAVESERARMEHDARATLVRRLLRGISSPEQLAALAERAGLDPTGAFHAVRARPGMAADAGRIERLLLGAGAPAGPNGLLALVDGDVCGVVRRLPADHCPVPVGLSAAVPLAELSSAFRQATRLLEAALALGRDGLIDVAALGVDAAVVWDDEVGEAMLDRYVRPLQALGAAGELILDTVSRYLGNDARLDTTARELHVHVNTVRYRLGRFEQVTSCSLRRHDTLVEVWWALRRRTLRQASANITKGS